MLSITQLENEINTLLKESYCTVVNDNVKMQRLANVYRSEVKKGFYEGKHEGEGEFPGERRPNEAFMKIAEDIWSPVEGKRANSRFNRIRPPIPPAPAPPSKLTAAISAF